METQFIDAAQKGYSRFQGNVGISSKLALRMRVLSVSGSVLLRCLPDSLTAVKNVTGGYRNSQTRSGGLREWVDRTNRPTSIEKAILEAGLLHPLDSAGLSL